MTTKDIRELAPGIGKKVKVTNSKYIGGGYEGKILEIGADTLLVQHPLGSDAYEKIGECELIQN